ncbi:MULTISPECIES: HTH domain-containing protein [Halorussus]|uniref:HTH domain-containing protein n=1 Tax=Halorussus TaxID=1070314 RepID=UPI0020A0044E|nr:HTH domain-containing protein [Halorussus vallis]USZ75302.1 hypothetical protein NGM07_17945 [Halorussus vallis]
MNDANAQLRNGESTLRARLFTQGFAPSGAEDVPGTLFERLERLEREGTIDECDVEVWGRKVCRRVRGDRPALGGDVLATVDEFREWADRTGASVDHCFEEHEVRSEMTGEDRTELRLPVACLAVRYDDELAAVFPHAKDGREYTVADGLAALESSEGRSTSRPERLLH